MPHFVLTKMPDFFRPGETIMARRDARGEIVAFDRIDERSGKFIAAVEGYLTKDAPLDERARLPASIDGVQLWRNY